MNSFSLEGKDSNVYTREGLFEPGGSDAINPTVIL